MLRDCLRSGVDNFPDNEPMKHEHLAALYSGTGGEVYFASLPEGDTVLTGQVKVIAGHPQHRGGSGLLLVKIRPRGEVVYRVLVCHHDDEIGNVRESPAIVWRTFVGCGTTVFFESHAAHCARLNRIMGSDARMLSESAEIAAGNDS